MGPARQGSEGEQILPDRTPPGGLGIFKKRLCRMDAGSGQMVYVYFHSPTCPRDFPGTDFLIFGIVMWGKLDCQNEFFGHNFSSTQLF